MSDCPLENVATVTVLLLPAPTEEVNTVEREPVDRGKGHTNVVELEIMLLAEMRYTESDEGFKLAPLKLAV
eukprot:gene10949-biopygen7943